MTVFNIVHSVYLFYVICHIWTDMSENKLFAIVIVLLENSQANTQGHIPFIIIIIEQPF